jgi:DNA invertase Pin-like site-specific DNA recombinase
MIITYTYTDPIIDQIPDTFIWGLEVEKNYQDIGDRKFLDSLLKDCQINPPSYLLVRSLHELGDTCAEVISAIAFIESLKIEIIAIDQPYNSSKFKQINQ